MFKIMLILAFLFTIQESLCQKIDTVYTNKELSEYFANSVEPYRVLLVLKNPKYPQVNRLYENGEFVQTVCYNLDGTLRYIKNSPNNSTTEFYSNGIVKHVGKIYFDSLGQVIEPVQINLVNSIPVDLKFDRITKSHQFSRYDLQIFRKKYLFRNHLSPQSFWLNFDNGRTGYLLNYEENKRLVSLLFINDSTAIKLKEFRSEELMSNSVVSSIGFWDMNGDDKSDISIIAGFEKFEGRGKWTKILFGEVYFNRSNNFQTDSLVSNKVKYAKSIREISDLLDDHILTLSEIMPEFKGGTTAFYQYIKENMKYPTLAKQKGIQGMVHVEFVVEKDGSISRVKLVRGLGGGCDEEALRLIQNSPKWIPGSNKGKFVNVKMLLPVLFKL